MRPIIEFSLTIPWQDFEDEFKIYYKKGGTPAKPIRLMVGLLILKQLNNLSDETLVVQWKQSQYYHAFCGMKEFQLKEPCHITELVKFRNRIGMDGFEML